MKKIILSILFIGMTHILFAQEEKEIKLDSLQFSELFKNIDFDKKEKEDFLKRSDEACLCIDSIALLNRTKNQVHADISDCIKKHTEGVSMANELFKKLMNPDLLKDSSKHVEINITDGEKGDEIEYAKMENYLLSKCPSMMQAVKADNEERTNSVSENVLALKYYDEGNTAMGINDYDEAIKQYKKALDIDSNFAFCWDNLGLCYRKTNQYSKALYCYKKSLEVDPTGGMPMQNIPIVYEYMKDYKQALNEYNNLIRRRPDDPEGYFGKARMLILLSDKEAAMEAICKSYVLYTEQKNPYRSDAANIIHGLYKEMLKSKKSKRQADEILKKYKLNIDK